MNCRREIVAVGFRVHVTDLLSYNCFIPQTGHFCLILDYQNTPKCFTLDIMGHKHKPRNQINTFQPKWLTF